MIKAFHGCELAYDDTPAAQEGAAEENACSGQSAEAAMNVFFGEDAPKKGMMVGSPIPGYSGSNRRIGADNLFGMTYAEARNAAGQSQANIDNEKGNTLLATSKFVPAYEGKTNQWNM